MNDKQLDYKITTLKLSLKEIDEIHMKALKKLNTFIEFLLTIIKKYVSLKMNPMVKYARWHLIERVLQI